MIDTSSMLQVSIPLPFIIYRAMGKVMKLSFNTLPFMLIYALVLLLSFLIKQKAKSRKRRIIPCLEKVCLPIHCNGYDARPLPGGSKLKEF